MNSEQTNIKKLYPHVLTKKHLQGIKQIKVPNPELSTIRT